MVHAAIIDKLGVKHARLVSIRCPKILVRSAVIIQGVLIGQGIWENT